RRIFEVRAVLEISRAPVENMNRLSRVEIYRRAAFVFSVDYDHVSFFILTVNCFGKRARRQIRLELDQRPVRAEKEHGHHQSKADVGCRVPVLAPEKQSGHSSYSERERRPDDWDLKRSKRLRSQIEH